MTISDRIFERLRQINMSQKVFSEETGISQSTISEWKSKRTNPTSEKIMLICKALDVTPEWLLSGIENTGDRGNNVNWYVIDKDTEMGSLISSYHGMDERQRERLRGYMEAIMALKDDGKER
nr:helix-turn-helix transcriptional regulator [uncultured Butyrivibrio sp.]